MEKKLKGIKNKQALEQLAHRGNQVMKPLAMTFS
jgi:hypothetical protein